MNVSQSEQVLLDILWQEEPLTVGQIIERAQRQEDWHENTIKTMLTRMVGKEILAREKDGKRYFYRSAISRSDLIGGETEGLLSRFFGGKLSPLVAHFAKEGSVSKDELDEIQAILDRMKADD